MTEADSILRKLMEQDDAYVALYHGSVCIDGWIGDLTDTEVAYLMGLGLRVDCAVQGCEKPHSGASTEEPK